MKTDFFNFIKIVEKNINQSLSKTNPNEKLACFYDDKNGKSISFLIMNKNINQKFDVDLSKLNDNIYSLDKESKLFKKLGFVLSKEKRCDKLLLTLNCFKKLKINDYVCLDLDDVKEKKETIFSVPVFNIPNKKWINLNVVKYVKYARLVATKRMVVKGKVIEPGTKGAYIEIKENFFQNEKTSVKIGENSWIEGSFMGTELHPSFVQKHSHIGKNTLINANATLEKNVVVGDNCDISYPCTLGKNTIIGNNTKCVDITTGPNTLIGDNSQIGVVSLENKTAIGGKNYIGVSPNYWNYYWWNTNKEPKHLGTISPKFTEIAKRFFSEKYYALKTTRIGANVKTDRNLFIESGVTIGDDAKIGYAVKVLKNKQVENKSITQDKTLIQ